MGSVTQILEGPDGPSVALTIEGDVMYATRRLSTGELLTTKEYVEREGEEQRMTFVRVDSRRHEPTEEITADVLRGIHEKHVEQMRDRA